MNIVRFVLAVIALAILAGCAGTAGYRVDPSVQVSTQSAQIAVYPPKSCTSPDWEEGEKWAQGANAGTGSTNSGSVERKFRAEKGGQSNSYDSNGNCTYNTDSNARSRR